MDTGIGYSIVQLNSKTKAEYIISSYLHINTV
jgi:hypothetical protein